MEPTYWHRQAGKALFEDMLWSRPENRRSAGKLLIVGGNAHSVTAPAFAYQAAMNAGIGTAHVLLPDAIAKTIGQSFPEGEFAFSTPSGSFAKTAINQVIESSDWADGLILAGDFGHNSETAILLEQISEKYQGQLTLTQDSLDYFAADLARLTERDNTLMVVSLPKLQKMTRAGMPSRIIQQAMSLHALVGLLNSWTRESKLRLLTYHNESFVYADGGQVSTTPAEAPKDWEVPLAAHAATWWLQNKTRSFEAITSAVYDFSK